MAIMTARGRARTVPRLFAIAKTLSGVAKEKVGKAADSWNPLTRR